MPKQPVTINFSQGLNTKTDPWQLPIGQFQSLQNSIFLKQGQLRKRNGYGVLSKLPGSYNYLTTLNNNLTAIGQNIAAYDPGRRVWVPKGNIQPASLSVLPLVRNSVNQTQCDYVVAPNGLTCTVYTETNNAVSTYKYVIANSVTGQNVIAPTAIPASTGVVTGSPRVFLLGNYFVIVFTNIISASNHLQYVTISSNNPSVVTTNADIATGYTTASTVSWDGVVFNNNLYLSYNTTSGGQSVKVTYLSQQSASLGAAPNTPHTFAGRIATMMSMCVDQTVSVPAIYLSFYDAAGSTGYTASVDVNLNVLQAPVQIISSGTVLNITCAAQNGTCSSYFEISNAYVYDGAIFSNYINLVTLTSGTAAAAITVIRSLGLGSKAFIIGGVIYFLGAYSSQYQSSYFLVNGSSVQASPLLTAKLAYGNGGGYLTLGLPGVIVNGLTAQIPYLFKDLILPVSRTNTTQQTITPGVYAQTGINLATFNLGLSNVTSVEIASGLQIAGGFGWLYDGYLPVEQGFFLFPENIEATTNASAVTPTGTTTTGSNVITAVSSISGVGIGASISGTGVPASQKVTGVTSNTITFGPLTATGNNVGTTITVTGNIDTAQQFFYQAVYQWTDNAGNIQNSVPSIPVSVTTTGTTSTNTIYIPTLRLTYKTANPVKLVLFRWGADQPVYYQVTSISAATLNATTSDSITFFDCQSKASILGNSIIYTTGGVVEDVNPPSSDVMTLFDTRAWLVNAEDPNQLWFSKQVIPFTPVEWSDLLTLYIAPNAGTVSTTGPITALAPMDDKLIIFKQNSMYYINGTGPDNTGNPSPSYNGPIFITATVGCTNPSSIVLIDAGLMFQSNKGIWLLPRGLGAPEYIGAAVENFNASAVQSAVSVPMSNEIRQTLSTGQTLMFDYFYRQWGTFVGAPAITSCIYQNLHSYIDKYGRVFQETPGVYLDGSNPTLMSFTTGWITTAGIQGFQRFHYFYLMGQYLSPHKLQILVSYDYNPSYSQELIITPDNYSSAATSPYGEQSAPFGSPTNLEQWEFHIQKQKCESFQITVNELFDPSLGVPAGAGLTLSGINMFVSLKSAKFPIRSSNTAG